MRTSILLPTIFALGIAPLTAAFLKPIQRPSESNTEKALKIQEVKNSLKGLWRATHPKKEGDVIRFYYFHSGDIGLVRYGRMGLSYTRAFHWNVVSPQELVINFTKSGESHKVRYQLDKDHSRLTLPEDPVFPGEQRYTKDAQPRGVTVQRPETPKEHPLARLWIHETKDRKDSIIFRMYQLQPPTIDGRGVGWFHEGDMTEWSTETLTYRHTGDSITFDFPVRNERHSTSLEISKGSRRTFTLGEDPRNFWHPRTYLDGGPGFTTYLDGELLPYK